MNTVKISLGCAILVASLLIFNTVFAADEEAKAKHTIKEVMKIAHKDGLLKKVLGGDTSQDEKLVLLDSYISLMENKPPKGDEGSWHNLAGQAVIAAAKVAAGRDATADLKKATACGTCHKAHKG